MPGSSILPDDKIAFLLVTGLCSGMSIITCGFVIFTYVSPRPSSSFHPYLTPHSMGVSFNLRSDRNRQQFLAMISFCAAVFGAVGNGLQEGRLGTSVGDKIVSFFFNWFVQVRPTPNHQSVLSFMIIQAWSCGNSTYQCHSVRTTSLELIVSNARHSLLTAVLRSPAPAMIARVNLICCSFYFLTLPAMTPTFISLTQPADVAVKSVSRNMNIAFVCAIELFAVTADVMLLNRFTQHKRNSQRVRLGMMKDMWIVYVFVWLSICADVTAKVLAL